jgi:putative transposase
MARSLRHLEPGAVYHVTARGHDREPIVLDDADRLRFERILASTAERFHWGVLAWCLMDNHYHLILIDRDASLDRGMQRLHLSVAAGFRRRYGGCGALFQGRYTLRRIRDWRYLLVAVRYCLRNPVVARMAAVAEDWRWSSARVLMGLEMPRIWMVVDPILRALGAEGPRRREAVRVFLR